MDAMHGKESQTKKKTAFIFAGGGSFGAIQVGMMQALAAHGVTADLVVGSSVGAMNGAYYTVRRRWTGSRNWRTSGAG